MNATKRAGDLKVGDRYEWYGRWHTVTLIARTDRDRIGDEKGNGVYVCSGTGMPTRFWGGQMLEVQP